MYPITFEIWCVDSMGKHFMAFHWSRDAKSGIERALRESIVFDVDVIRAYAIPYTRKEI